MQEALIDVAGILSPPLPMGVGFRRYVRYCVPVLPVTVMGEVAPLLRMAF